MNQDYDRLRIAHDNLIRFIKEEVNVSSLTEKTLICDELTDDDNLWQNFNKFYRVYTKYLDRVFPHPSALRFVPDFHVASFIKQERVDYFANKIGSTYASLNFKEAKARWGSCGANQSININWRIMMCPQFVMDYVIVHELSHLQFKNHSKDFWKRVETIMPDYRDAQEWLQQNSGLVNIY